MEILARRAEKETLNVRNMCERPFAQHLIIHSYAYTEYAYTKSAARQTEPNENHSPNLPLGVVAPHSHASAQASNHALRENRRRAKKKEASERLLRREKRWNSIVSLSKHEMQIELNFSFHSISFEKFLAMPLRDTSS